MRQSKNLEPRSDLIGSETALAARLSGMKAPVRQTAAKTGAHSFAVQPEHNS
jgi:hypothetical protein